MKLYQVIFWFTGQTEYISPLPEFLLLPNLVLNWLIIDYIDCLHFHKVYGYHTWQVGDLPCRFFIDIVTWPMNHMILQDYLTNLKHISTTIVPMTTKVSSVLTYHEGFIPIKFLTLWSRGLSKSQALRSRETEGQFF